MQSGFFLGANSKNGFTSFYSTLSEEVEKLYIIKGSPGGGKSTFMRRVQSRLSGPSECIYCSSDPQSLDAVIFPEQKLALVDGTAPHVVEPTYHLAREEYVDLTRFATPALLDRDAVIQTTQRYRAKSHRIHRLISCAGILREEVRELALGGVSKERMVKKAAGILSREVCPLKKEGRAVKRFLSAISPEGAVTLFDTVKCHSDRVYELDDSYHLATPLLEELLRRTVGMGHMVYACYSPLSPDTLEHLILPEARLAFVTSNAFQQYPYTPTRRIRIDAMMDSTYRKAHRGKLKFAASLSEALLAEAYEELAAAKLIHDELEALYHPCIDFDGILGFADELAQKISGISH